MEIKKELLNSKEKVYYRPTTLEELNFVIGVLVSNGFKNLIRKRLFTTIEDLTIDFSDKSFRLINRQYETYNSRFKHIIEIFTEKELDDLAKRHIIITGYGWVDPSMNGGENEFFIVIKINGNFISLIIDIKTQDVFSEFFKTVDRLISNLIIEKELQIEKIKCEKNELKIIKQMLHDGE